MLHTKNFDTRRFYIAGPMSGIPHFNFPAFMKATLQLREAGYNIVSPHELDDPETQKLSWESLDGAQGKGGDTWGDLLARDVKLVSDGVDGIIFLPGWMKSRGARLEAFVALLCEKMYFATYDDGELTWVSPDYVVENLMENMPGDYAYDEHSFPHNGAY